MSSEQMERELVAVNVGDVYPVPDDAGEEIDDDLCDWIAGDVAPVHEGPYVRSFDVHLLPPPDERSNLRSATPAGFAHAVFEANHNRVLEAA